MKNANTLTTSAAKRQSGVMLIEALVALLIFSMGILAVVGLQAVAVKHTTQAKHRADAAFLVNNILGQMRAVNPTTISSFAHNAAAAACPFAGTASGNALVTAWAADIGNMFPTATTQIQVGANNLVTVSICWQNPGDGAAYRNYTAVSQILG